MHNMTEYQLSFWRALLAPFPDNELSTVKKGGGRELTYVDSRALTNRLDSICGPHGWDIEYRPTDRGYTARMGIAVPTSQGPGTDVWLYKEDGGGFEDMGMKNRDTGEWEADIDNDEKSAYTNALRRVAQNAWGIGRYLYRKGIPTWLDPNASPTPMLDALHGVADQQRAAASPAPASQPPPARERTTRDHTESHNSPSPEPVAPAAPRKYDNFKIPPTGKPVFAWAKEMETTFEAKLIPGMGDSGEKKGFGRVFADWTTEQVREIALGCISYIKTLPTYKGQFDHLESPPYGQSAPAPAPAANPAPAAPTPGVNIADLRRDLMTKMQAFCKHQTGRVAENGELKQAFAKIAPLCKTGEGKLGETPEALGKLTDIVWIRNMISMMEQQIALAVANADQGDDEIPF